MAVAALYARFSTEDQRATSIEDQLRRCRALAAQHGIEVDEALVFFDAAVSGAASALEKREGYRKLIEAWDARRFEVILTDEVSRLARDVLELAKLQVKVANSGVRLLCADGVDSAHQGWQLLFGIKSAIGAHFLEETRHRVLRGMRGQLERGYMSGKAPFGYDIVRELDASGTPRGTRWKVNHDEAALVRDMYAQRNAGSSYAAIARSLNQRGIPLRRAARNKRLGGYWRASRVCALLQNTIYRGVFTWNGSAFTRAKAKKVHRTVESVDYLRPELRIVDDSVWFICNEGRVSRTRRGGGRHALAGLLTCGRCGATLEAAAHGRVLALHCVQCEQAHRVGALEKGPPYVSASGVVALLTHVLERCLTGEVVVEFRRRLKAFVTAERQVEVHSLGVELRRAESACTRLVRLIREVDKDDGLLEREYRDARAQRDKVAARLRAAEDASQESLKEAARAQLSADPRVLLPRLFEAAAPAERVRAVLHRLFPSIVLEKKLSRFVSVYQVTVAPGVAHAEATGTQMVEDVQVALRFQVSTSARRPVVWHIEQLV